MAHFFPGLQLIQNALISNDIVKKVKWLSTSKNYVVLFATLSHHFLIKKTWLITHVFVRMYVSTCHHFEMQLQAVSCQKTEYRVWVRNKETKILMVHFISLVHVQGINNCTKRASRNNPQKQLPKIINIEYEWLMCGKTISTLIWESTLIRFQQS